MTGLDYKVLWLTGGGGVAFLLCAFNLYKQKEKVSSFHKAVNFLLCGSMLLFFFVVALVFYTVDAQGYKILNKNMFYLMGTIWGGICSFICGLHGILKRKKIKDEAFFILCVSQLLGSIMTAVFVIIMISSNWAWQ
ncbi:MAG: hypothetical protein HGB35_00770 [Geobacteraceae bacterium]|nr:hypothetical protein [Geobacteraceae bacterium]